MTCPCCPRAASHVHAVCKLPACLLAFACLAAIAPFHAPWRVGMRIRRNQTALEALIGFLQQQLSDAHNVC